MNLPGGARLADYRTLLSSKFGQDVLWNMGSLIFLAGGGVLINLIIVRLRGDAALGVFNQVYAFYIVLSQIGVGGLQFSVLKHVSYQQTDRALCGDITTAALILVAAISIPLSIIAALLAEPVGALLKSPSVAQGILFVAPGLVFFAMNKVLINTLNGLRMMRAYAIFRSLRFVLIPACIVVISLMSLDDAYLSLSLTISEALLLVALAIYVYAAVIPLRRIAHARDRFSEHISFGVRGVLSGVLTELNTRVDVLILGYFVSDTTVGVFSFAAIMAEGLSQIPMAVRWNVDPIMGEYFAAGEPSRITDLARRIRRVFYPVMAGIGVLVALAYRLLYQVLAGGDQPGESWKVFILITAGVVISAGYRPFAGLLLQAGRPGLYTGFIAVLVALNAVVNLLLIPRFGLYGAASATMLTFIFEAALLVILARRVLGIRL